MSMVSQLPFLLPACFLLAAILIPLVGVWRSEAAYWIGLFAAGISAICALYGFVTVPSDELPLYYFFGGWRPPVGIEFVYDGLSAFVVCVINVVAFFAILYSKQIGQLEYSGKQVPFHALTMLMMFGFNGMVLTGDLFNLYVFLEVSSLSSYALLAIGERRAPYAAFRYLIIGTLGGSLYLLGVGFLYTVSGTLNMRDMADILLQLDIAGNAAVQVALVLMVVGIGVKAAMFPVHGWLPDVYSHANSATSVLIPAIGTKVAAYILFRVLLFIFGAVSMEFTEPVLTVIGILASLGILYGSIMAIGQYDLKRMLAYSSISQIGYVLLGLSLANPLGFAGALLHLLTHAIMKSCLFMFAGQLRLHEGHSDIRRFDGRLRERHPWMCVAFVIAAISMIGLPPLAGFFSKWYLALGTIENGNWWLLAVILISSLLNAVYFFRILERLYLKPGTEAEPAVEGAHAPGSGGANGSALLPNVPAVSRMLPTYVFALSLLVIGILNVWIIDTLLPVFPLKL